MEATSFCVYGIISEFTFSRLEWSLTVLCLQGWLPRCNADMLRVMWQMFHLCAMKNGEALQRGGGGGWRRERRCTTEIPAKQTISGIWESVVSRSSSRPVGFPIAAVNCTQLPHAWLSLIRVCSLLFCVLRLSDLLPLSTSFLAISLPVNLCSCLLPFLFSRCVQRRGCMT